MSTTDKTSLQIGIIGLGYVGIQLAIAFGKNYDVIGFDSSEFKISSYRTGIDPAGQVSRSQFKSAVRLNFTSSKDDLSGSSIFIVAVPTPVDQDNHPDFSALIEASRTVGAVMNKESIVIYESTVYPGATEEICVPVLEEASELLWKKDFHIGYSPERINPGDSEHTLQSITKVVSADNDSTLEVVADLYRSIVSAGVHKASSIAIAEAAKVIENTQRDLNIALINELSLIFDRLGIDTTEVLEVAGTKWNFVPFRPGLVGGHCIGVDPYYLTYKAEMIGYKPEVILAGRRINDNMGAFVADKIREHVHSLGIERSDCDINVLGVTFKANCPDIRNSQVFKLIGHLATYGFSLNITDAMADTDAVLNTEGLALKSISELKAAPVLVLAVAHDEYMMKKQHLIDTLVSTPGVVIDITNQLRSCEFPSHTRYWSL
ncbi:MAG: GDP-mannose dehydrogenase [Acidiferrobacteraceae bacterium]|nr:GDP-mannose dehydrogenase [Acidiferrobacteraceae bacterium]